VLGTFHFVTACWILFRAESFSVAWSYFQNLATFTTFQSTLDPRVLAVLAVGLASHYVPHPLYAAVRARFMALPAVAQGVALFAAALVIREMASADAVPFVYFQF
jgi:hypothetical protein